MTTGRRQILELHLQTLENQLAAQGAALAEVPPGCPLPVRTVELMTTPPPLLPALTPGDADLLPRLAAALANVAELTETVEQHRRELGHALGALRSARRGRPAPALVDRTA